MIANSILSGNHQTKYHIVFTGSHWQWWQAKYSVMIIIIPNAFFLIKDSEFTIQMNGDYRGNDSNNKFLDCIDKCSDPPCSLLPVNSLERARCENKRRLCYEKCGVKPCNFMGLRKYWDTLNAVGSKR
jgi:hypothetical protein